MSTYILWPVYFSRTLHCAVVQVPPTAPAARLTVMAGPQDPLPPARSALPKSPMTGPESIHSQGACSPATPKKRQVELVERISFVRLPLVILTLVLFCFVFFCHQPSIPSRHTDERRKADKLKKKKRRKERQPSAEEDTLVPEFQHPISFRGQTIKEEPEDEISIPLHPQRLLSPVPCKEEPSEGQQNWDGQDLKEGVVRVQKVEGFSGNRTVFRQGKQVVFRDEDGSGEDEDIMVDSGKRKLISFCGCSSAPDCPQPDSMSSVPRWRLLGPGDVFLHEALCRPSNDWVQQVSHLDSFVVRQNPQEPRARDVRLPEVPGDPRPPGHPPLPPFTRGPQQTHAWLTGRRSSEDIDPFCSELSPPRIRVLHWSLSSARNSCFVVTLVWTFPWPCPCYFRTPEVWFCCPTDSVRKAITEWMSVCGTF